MAKESNKRVFKSTDAAGIEPKLVPDVELLPRDDSGGPEYEPYTQQFGDGGFVTGEKPHLGTGGGEEDPIEGDEISEGIRKGSAKTYSKSQEGIPARSKAEARE